MSSGKCVRTVVSERIFADLRSHQIFSKSSYRCRAFPHAYLRCGIDGSRWRRDGSASGVQFSRGLVLGAASPPPHFVSPSFREDTVRRLVFLHHRQQTASRRKQHRIVASLPPTCTFGHLHNGSNRWHYIVGRRSTGPQFGSRQTRHHVLDTSTTSGLARSLERNSLRDFRCVKSWMSPRYATALCKVYSRYHQAFGCRPALYCTSIP
jgi:hypothetical protein